MWIQSPVLYSRPLRVIHFIYSRVRMFIPVFMEAYFSENETHHRAGSSNRAGPGINGAVHRGTSWDGTCPQKEARVSGVWYSLIEGLVAGLTIHLEENKFVPNIYEKGLNPECKI